MKIELWRAFASNNSGSYTIVGSFPTEADAAAAAAELAAVIAEHEAWVKDEDAPPPSPLRQWAESLGLRALPGDVRDDAWPHYGSTPTVGAVGSQLLLFVDYTVTMPRVFGEFFFLRGGRVDTELVHSHAPLVWLHELWWPWQGRTPESIAHGRAAVLDAAFAEDGPLVTLRAPGHAPSWTTSDHFIVAPLTIAASWRDPVAGAAALAEIARRCGASMGSRVIEAWRDDDPAGLFRPSRPAVPRGLFDVWLRASGPAPEEIVRRLSIALFEVDGRHADAVAMLGRVPCVIAQVLPEAMAQQLAAGLRDAGAIVELTPHPSA